MESLTKKLVIIAAILGPIGAIFGSTSDIIEIIFPSPVEPDVFTGLDVNAEGFDHSNNPKKIRFTLTHNGTDTFYIETINLRTKLFHSIDDDCLVPSDDPDTFKSQDAWINPPLSEMFDVVKFKMTEKRADNFVTIDNRTDLHILYNESDPLLIFDYVILDRNGNVNTESMGFWQDMVIGYNEVDGDQIKYAKYHAHGIDNIQFCKK